MRVYGFHYFFRIGAAVGTESVNEQLMLTQGRKQPFQGFCLTELYRRIAVSVLYMDDYTAHACHTGEITERFLVGVRGIVFLRGNELMVKVHIQELTTLEKSHGHVEFHQ